MSVREWAVGFGIIPPPGSTPPQPLDLSDLIIIAAVSAAVIAVVVWQWWKSQTERRAAIRNRMTHALVLSAARLAGRRRSHLRDDWMADLAGTPEEGRPLTPAQKIRYARGCLRAAARLRAAGCLDETLASTIRCTIATAGPVAVAAMMLVRQQGPLALLMHADKLAYLGGLLSLAIRWARRKRGVASATKQSQKNRDTQSR